MRKRHSILLLILIGIGVLFYAASPAMRQEQQRVVQAPSLKSGTGVKSDTNGNDPADARERKHDEMDKQSAELAKMRTPELTRMMVDRLMQTRDAKYRELFSAWGVDANTASSTLQIIRDREMQVKEALKTSEEDGLKGVHQFVQTINAINSMTDTLLLRLLGEDRLQELILVETDMKARSATRGREVAKKYAPHG